MRRLKIGIVAAALAAGAIAGVAYATHLFPPQLPAGAAQGYFVSNNRISDIPVGSFAQAVRPDGGRLFVQHLTLGPGQKSGWHTHPGPAIVMVVSGELTLQEPVGSNCKVETASAGEGFVNAGGNVHQATAGTSGADTWAVYVLPPDAHAVRDPVSPAASLPTPPACE
jgi:quercetin dioxygenase-like cupin family protein